MATIAEFISQNTNNSTWNFKASAQMTLDVEAQKKRLATLRIKLADLNKQITLQEMAFAKAVQENFLGYTGEVRSNINSLKAQRNSLRAQLEA
jgi:hypothetical protein